jgi:hypothetical protein
MIYAMFRYFCANITCQYVTCKYHMSVCQCKYHSSLCNVQVSHVSVSRASITCLLVTCKYHMSVCHLQVSVCKTAFYGIILVINPIYMPRHKTPNSYEELQTVLFVSVCSAPSSDQTEHQSLALLALDLYHAHSAG